jgi:hypothetical protein
MGLSLLGTQVLAFGDDVGGGEPQRGTGGPGADRDRACGLALAVAAGAALSSRALAVPDHARTAPDLAAIG